MTLPIDVISCTIVIQWVVMIMTSGSAKGLANKIRLTVRSGDMYPGLPEDSFNGLPRYRNAMHMQLDLQRDKFCTVYCSAVPFRCIT